MKNCGEKGACAYPGTAHIFEYPVLSQERVKLRNSNLAGIFTGCIRTKAPYNLGEKAVWAYPGTAQIFEYPLLSQEQIMLRSFNFVRTFLLSIGTKVRYKFRETYCGLTH